MLLDSRLIEIFNEFQYCNLSFLSEFASSGFFLKVDIFMAAAKGVALTAFVPC